jgi:hypothetical protein
MTLGHPAEPGDWDEACQNRHIYILFLLKTDIVDIKPRNIQIAAGP